MSVVEVNGVDIYYELHGSAGEPLALVHGSWADTSQWAQVVPGLARDYLVLTYDRRGHSRSEDGEGQGSLDEDAEDLADLIDGLGLAPAHVVTNSLGGNVALRTAIRHEEVMRSLTCHEPPLWALLADDPDSQELLAQGAASLESVGAKIAADDLEDAARQFVDEVAFGPGTWDNALPDDVKAMFVRNAPTFLDELQDPEQLWVDTEALGSVAIPVHLSQGSESPPMFARILDRLERAIPRVTRETIDGAAHVPQLTTPDAFVESTRRAIQAVA